MHIQMGEAFMTEEYTFNIPDKKFREVEGIEVQILGLGGVCRPMLCGLKLGSQSSL